MVTLNLRHMALKLCLFNLFKYIFASGIPIEIDFYSSVIEKYLYLKVDKYV